MLPAAAQNAPAFPGAEGHGRYVTGGRGGKVYHVTSLADDGSEGTLRWALKQSGARTIVFDVSGTIELTSNLQISNGAVSVLGQTAPYPGITIAYYTCEPKTSNIIMRFLRFRRSQVKDVNDGADALFARNRNNIIIDHCSFSWSIDEVVSCYDNKNFTLQWSTAAEGLCNPGHSKGSHSYGGIWGGKQASFHHIFLAHCQNRMPRFNGARYQQTNFDKTLFENTVDGERVDFRNCLIYNWGNGNGCYGGPGGGYINMVNNYYKAGPGTSNKTRVTQVTVGSSGNSTPTELRGLCSRYFIEGNYVTAAGDKAENYDWQGVIYDGGLVMKDGENYMKDPNHKFGSKVEYVNINGVDCVKVKLDSPIDAGEVTTHSAQTAYEKVLELSGACLYRDAVDARYMEECRTGTVTYQGNVPMPGKSEKSGTKGIVDWVNDPAAATQEAGVPSFPELESNTRPADWDTDGDGIPNEWEILNGLDPDDPADGALYTLDSEKHWYTNLEVYANSLVEPIMKACQADGLNNINEYYPAFVAAGVEAPEVSSEVIAIEYYNLQGVRVAEPAANGITLRRLIFSDGHSETDKVIKR